MTVIKRTKFIWFMVLAILVNMLVIPMNTTFAAGQTYYISSSSGDDSNNGTSASTPWKSFAKANTVVFQPSDQILLKSGDTWTGTTFYPHGNGTVTNPILISSYGTGNKPILSGSETTNVYGIKIVDFSGYKITNLEFGNIPAGISMWFNNTIGNDYLWVENCYFHDSELANHAYYDAVSGHMWLPYPDLYTGTGIAIGGVDTVGGRRIISNVTLTGNTFYRTETGIFTEVTSNNTDMSHQYTDLLTNNEIGNFNVTSSTFTQNYGGRSLRLSYTNGGGVDGVTVDQTGYQKGDSNGVAGIEIIKSSGLLLANFEVKNTLVFGTSINGSGVDISKGNQNITLSGCNLHDNVGAAFDSYQNNTNIVVDNCTLKNNNVSKYTGNKTYWVGTGNTGGTISNSKIYLQNDAQLYNAAILSPMTFASSNSVWNSSGALISGTSILPTPVPSRLKVGVAKYDITPTVPTATDWGSAYVATPPGDILDHIFVRFMVLQDSVTDKRLVFVIPDMCLYDELARDPMRVFPTGTLQRFADAAGVPTSQIFVIPTHNHQGPEKITDETILQGFITGIETAVANLTPANMGYIVDRNSLGVNRRPDYRVAADLAYDNRLVGIKFTKVSDGMPIAAAINYPVHNTGLGNEVTANWNKITTELTGIGINYIESQYSSLNPNFTALFLNGFFGDAGPDIYGNKNASYSTIVARGQQFGSEVLQFINNVVPAPLTQPVDSYQATQTVSSIPGDAYSTYDLTFDGARIGADIGFIGVNSEPFSEIGASIRAKSPFKVTLLSGNVSGDSGYAPTYDAYHDGIAGFETILPKGPFYDTIEQVLTTNSLNVLNTLYGGGGDGLVKYAAIGTAKDFNPFTPVSNAFDSNTRTKWVSANGTPTWLQADLGSSKNISRVVMNYGNFDKREAGKDIEIRVSNDVDFSTYTTAARDRNNSSPQVAYRFDSINARYVRFYSTSGYGSDSRVDPAVYEMEIWGSSAAGSASPTPTPTPMPFPGDALLTDNFSSGLSKWVNTTNATISSGQLNLTNNDIMRSSTGSAWTNYTYETDAAITANGYLGLSFRAADNNNYYMWQFSYGALGFLKRVAGGWQQVKSYITLPMDLVTGIAHHYKIEVNGSSLKTYIDDVLVDTTTDNTFSSGAVGLWTGSTDMAAFDNVVVRPISVAATPTPTPFPAGALLTDDYSSGLSKWENTTNATISNGQLTLTNNEIMRSSAGSSWTNYTYDLDAAITNGYMGLSFRATDDNNYYMWQFSSGTLGFLKKVAGSWQTIKPYITIPAPAVMAPGKMSHIKIEANGSKINTYINGMLVDSTEDTTFSTGKVGFRQYSTDTAVFDNVVVQAITATDEVHTGLDTAGANAEVTGAGNFAATKFVAGQNVIVNKMRLYVASSATGNVKMAIYSDNAGSPGALLAQTSAIALANGWNTGALPSTYLNAGTTYWLAFDLSAAGSSLRYNTGVSVDSKYTGYAYASAFPASAPGALTATIGKYSIYTSN